MKNFVFLIIFSTVISFVHAQSDTWQQNIKQPDVYIGLASGMESFAGLIGITADFRARNNFYLRAGAGIGSWGGKISIGIRNEKKAEKSIGYGCFVSWASGLKDFTTSLETTSGTKDVKLDLLATYTIVPSINYKWVLKNGNRFFLEGGYAVPLDETAWKVKDGSILTDSSKNMMKILQPGGLSLGLGFQFAL